MVFMEIATFALACTIAFRAVRHAASRSGTGNRLVISDAHGLSCTPLSLLLYQVRTAVRIILPSMRLLATSREIMEIKSHYEVPGTRYEV